MENDNLERDIFECDLLFVGGGPASLSGAIHLKRLIKAHNQENPENPMEPMICLIEKGDPLSAHAISGAVVDPRALKELLTEEEFKKVPFEAPVHKEQMAYLTPTSKVKFPIVPRQVQHHGCYTASLNKIVDYLASIAVNEGIEIMPGFPGAHLLWEGDRVVGVRTRETGVEKSGEPGANFTPGTDIKCPLTLLGEGVRGTLTKELLKKIPLASGSTNQIFSVGVKELWQVQPGKMAPGEVIHTMGFPISSDLFGGGFAYGFEGDQISLGVVLSLDYADPSLDPHQLFQKWKTHPSIAALLEGGKIIKYGAKCIPEGGFYAVPRVVHDGVMLLGDSAGFVNVLRLKGIHLAMKSGMLAAETAFEALKKRAFDRETLEQYEKSWKKSWMGEELYQSRNFRQGFKNGLFLGALNATIQFFTGGRGLWERQEIAMDHQEYEPLSPSHQLTSPQNSFQGDGVLTFDKLTDVFHSGTQHEENQPSHLKIADTSICNTQCTEEYGNPCQNFCPAKVYEMVPDKNGKPEIKLNPSNCVHCKTCDIKDPYQIIDWVPPEGGGGPDYKGM